MCVLTAVTRGNDQNYVEYGLEIDAVENGILTVSKTSGATDDARGDLLHVRSRVVHRWDT